MAHVRISAIDYITKQFNAYGGELTNSQKQLIHALDSCQITIIDANSRCSGVTSALVSYMAWEFVNVEDRLSFEYVAHKDEILHKEYILGGLAHFKKGKMFWENNYTGSTLEGGALNLLNPKHFIGRLPPNVIFIDSADRSQQVYSLLREHFYTTQSYIGRSLYDYVKYDINYSNDYKNLPAYEVKTAVYPGCRYAILDYNPIGLAKEFINMGIDGDTISVISTEPIRSATPFKFGSNNYNYSFGP